MVTALALAVAMLLAAFLGRRLRAGVVILVLLSLVWLTVDREFEGPVLWNLDGDHGLVLSDLVALAGFGVAIWLWLRRRAAHAPADPRRPVDADS